MKEARGVLLSKTGKKVVNPEDTCLITIQLLAMRSYDKTVL